MSSGNISIMRQWAVMTAREAAWAPVLVFAFHAIASRGFDAYTKFPQLDIPMHFFGGVVIAWFFHRAIANASKAGIWANYHPITHMVSIISLVGTTTIFWEFAEFLTDYFFHTHAQVDLPDTLFDMFLGLLGGFSLLIAMIARAKSLSITLAFVGVPK
jgi:hypothetical protein